MPLYGMPDPICLNGNGVMGLNARILLTRPFILTAPLSSNGKTVSVEEACVAAHNKARSKHQDTGDLVWDTTLATQAQDWANHLAENRKTEHSSGDYGENISWVASTVSGSVKTPAQATFSWCVFCMHLLKDIGS